MAVSKKTRFDVFKRDGFKCQYCGRNPPIVILEVDHIIPVSKNGTDRIDNLVTSCFDCNRGKTNGLLTSLPRTTAEKTKELKERELQYKEYCKVMESIAAREQNEIEKVDEIYSSYFNEFCLSDRFKNGSLRRFIKLIGFHKVERAMHNACTRVFDSDKAIKYFCGICWNEINNQ